MKILNLTPHDIVIYNDEMKVINCFKPSGILARCKTNEKETGFIEGIPTVSMSFGNIDNLPEPQKDTIYIVSNIVKEAGEKVGRHDLYVPTRQVRNEKGQIIGCKALGR